MPLALLGQSQSYNYVKTIKYKIPRSTVIPIPTIDQASQNVVYFDGLGRSTQEVNFAQSSTGKDVITHIEYDGFGNQTKSYLPYVRWYQNATMEYSSSALQETNAYYTTYDPSVSGNSAFEQTNYPYSEKKIEASPLNRIIKQAAPGDPWHMNSGKEIKFEYYTNSSNEVKLYNVNTIWNANSGLFDINLTNTNGNVFYNPNLLYKTITKNENWVSGVNNTVEEFKDTEGRLVLKRTYDNSVKYDTYYVYDKYGNITFVMPPLVNTNTTVSQEILDGLCYQYKYDAKNRLVEKKLPGKQWEFIVYDKLDRIIANGPANNPFGDGSIGWMITKYDLFNRQVFTGWKMDEVSASYRANLQNIQNTQSIYTCEEKITPTNTFYEDIEPLFINGVHIGYTNNVSPTSFILLTINYYDDYNFPEAPTIPTAVLTNLSQPVYYNNTDKKPKGLLTGSWVRVLQGSGVNNYEKSYVLYDSRARAVRNFTKNYFGGYTQVDSKIDFSGKTLLTETKHKRANADTELLVKDTFTYSLQDRLLMQTQQINALPEQLIVKNTYDELGQLISKNVGGTDTTGSAGLQKIDYKYNVRGWLKGINDINDLASENDLFAFKINYNTFEQTGSSDISPNLLYNGNISSTYWKTSTDNMIRKYNYTYDKLNRLVDATYLKPELNTSVNSYAENVSYDKNGNIQYLNRNGDLDSSVDLIGIDNLTYTYDTSKKNQLLRVTDSSNHPAGFDDSNNAGSGQDYYYDDNGNLISDANKTIQHITYNHLNLPVEILFTNNVRSIRYTYNAIGAKVKKHVVTDAPIRGNPNYGSTVTDYLDGFQYKNSILKLFPHAEGYVDAVASLFFQGYHFNYIFNYVDHLGNVRASYAGDFDTDGPNSAIIMEESHYYPFGLKHTKYNTNTYQYVNTLVSSYVTGIELMPPGITPDYKYKYNGKELQDELGLNMYDYGARNYDPAIGRWMNVDPLAEVSRRWSPYNYCMDNPVYFIDPDGRMTTQGSNGVGDPSREQRNGEGVSPSDHWQLNKQGKLELIEKTNDKFNVFFDDKGNKLFQTNQQSTEMTDKVWEGKVDEYTNKVKSVFIEIANEPAVFTQMEERAKETGFDEKFISLDKMKDVGEHYKSIGIAVGALDIVLEAPKWGVGFAYAGAKSLFGIGLQTVKSIYTSVKGTDLVKDAKSIYNQSVKNLNQFINNVESEFNHGVNQINNGKF